jgi:hypothetical protein
MGLLPEECPRPVRFTDDPGEVATADAVVFHLPNLDLAAWHRLDKPVGQLWVAWSLESRVSCPALDDPDLMARFDLTMTYERTSDVWHPYFGPALLAQLAQPPPATHVATPVVWLQSNGQDRTGRAGYVAQLLRRVQVDSFGEVLRTRPERIPPGAAARIELYRRYKFVLAFENSDCSDYVTEKVFDALRAGAVPVYRGCAEVAELLPSPDCYIDARAFASASELGAYLDHLDRDAAAYGAYQRWRGEPYQDGFARHLERLREPPLCRLAAEVAERMTASTPNREARP